MDYDQLYTFVNIAQTKNYSETAKLLNVTQPTVTARIRQLESELGGKLFHREGKTITLTKTGEVFSKYATKTLAYMDEAKAAVRKINDTGIKMGFSPGFSFSIISNLIELLNKELNVSIQVLNVDDSISLTNQVVEEELDLVLVLNPIIFSVQIAVEYLFDDKLSLIIGKEHHLADKGEIFPEDLEGETIFSYQRHTPLSIDIDEKLVGIKNIQRIEVNSIDTLKGLVAKGRGISIISSMGIDESEKGSILKIPFKPINSIQNKVFALYKKESIHTEVILSIIKYLANHPIRNG